MPRFDHTDVHGHADPRFTPVADAFRKHLAQSRGGGAVAVFYRGRPVVDLWGGVKDPSGAAWREHTPSLSFSTTKGVASTALHMCVDRGLLSYDDPVAWYWPEFAAEGKGRITVRHVMAHEAGLFDVRSITEGANDLLDWDTTVNALARARPSHPPGRHNAYHGLTYGYLVGELVRRVTGTHLRDFVREEMAAPLGLDHLHIGAPPEAIAAAARYFPLPERERLPRKGQRPTLRARAIGGGFRLLRLAGVADTRRTIRALVPKGITHFDWSSDEAMAACNPSASGVFTARALAKMYATLAAGGTLDGVRLLSPETVRTARRVQNRRPDGVLMFPMNWRLGYHSIVTRRGFHRGAFGHFGYRGSGAFADPRRHLAVAYITNWGGGSPVGDGRMVELSGLAAGVADAQSGRRRLRRR